jgi:hypothetical protein
MRQSFDRLSLLALPIGLGTGARRSGRNEALEPTGAAVRDNG